ncbi:hypothetical protein PV797_19440 [Clostridiaceae bacterium M8S5]|nr:hypothetical protein PV797_19440 [Clostridiaceae bacterium M8S5]
MQKTKFISLALILSLILIGAGYAGWTETFVSTNNINTGNLKIDYVEGNEKHQADIYEHYDEIWQNIHPGDNNDYNIKMDYERIKASNSDDAGSVIFNVTNLAPGTIYWSSFSLKNVGTVPAALKNVVASTSGDNELMEKITLSIIIDRNQDELFLCKYALLKDLKNIELTPTVMKKLKNGDSVTVDLVFYLDENSFEGDECENTSLQLALDYNFMQANIWTKP